MDIEMEFDDLTKDKKKLDFEKEDEDEEDDDSINLCGTAKDYNAIFQSFQTQQFQDLTYSNTIKEKLSSTTSSLLKGKKKKHKKSEGSKKPKMSKESQMNDDDDLQILEEISTDPNTLSRASSKDSLKTRSKKRETRRTRSKQLPNPSILCDIIDLSHDEPKKTCSFPISNGSKLYEEIAFEDLEPEALMFNLKIRYEDKIHKFRVSSDDKVFKCKKLLAEEIGLDQDDIILFRDKDDFIRPDDSKTLEEESIGVDIILEAYLKTNPFAKAMIGGDTRHDPNMIRLRLQGVNKADLLVLEFNKSRPFGDLCKRYAEKKGLDPSKIRLRFDGEFIDMGETPVDLDLEGEECLDVLF